MLTSFRRSAALPAEEFRETRAQDTAADEVLGVDADAAAAARLTAISTSVLAIILFILTAKSVHGFRQRLYFWRSVRSVGFQHEGQHFARRIDADFVARMTLFRSAGAIAAEIRRETRAQYRTGYKPVAGHSNRAAQISFARVNALVQFRRRFGLGHDDGG